MASSSEADDYSFIGLPTPTEGGLENYIKRNDGIIDFKRYAVFYALPEKTQKQIERDDQRLQKSIQTLRKRQADHWSTERLGADNIWLGTFGKKFFNYTLERMLREREYTPLPGTNSIKYYIRFLQDPNPPYQKYAHFLVSTDQQMLDRIYNPGLTGAWKTRNQQSQKLKTIHTTEKTDPPPVTTTTTSSSSQQQPQQQPEQPRLQPQQQSKLSAEEEAKMINHAITLDNIEQYYADQMQAIRARRSMERRYPKNFTPFEDYEYVHIEGDTGNKGDDRFPLTKPKFSYYYPNRLRYGKDKTEEYELEDNLPSYENEIFKGGNLSDNDDDDDDDDDDDYTDEDYGSPDYKKVVKYNIPEPDDDDDNDDDDKQPTTQTSSSLTNSIQPTTQVSNSLTSSTQPTTQSSSSLPGSIQPSIQPLKPPQPITNPSTLPKPVSLPQQKPPAVKPVFEPKLPTTDHPPNPKKPRIDPVKVLVRDLFYSTLNDFIELPLENYTLATLVRSKTGKMYMYKTYIAQLREELDKMGTLKIMVYRSETPAKDFIVQAFTKKFYRNYVSDESRQIPEELSGLSPKELLLLTVNMSGRNIGVQFTHVYPFHLYQTDIPLPVNKQPLNGDILALYTTFEIQEINFGNMKNMALFKRKLNQMEIEPTLYESSPYVDLHRGSFAAEQEKEIRQELSKINEERQRRGIEAQERKKIEAQERRKRRKEWRKIINEKIPGLNKNDIKYILDSAGDDDNLFYQLLAMEIKMIKDKKEAERITREEEERKRKEIEERRKKAEEEYRKKLGK